MAHLPAEIRQRLFSLNVDSYFFTLITIRAGLETFRIVNNALDITYSGNTYTATQFTFAMPNELVGEAQVAKLVLADVNNTFLDITRGYSEILCDVVQIMQVASSGQQYEERTRPYTFKLSNATWDAESVSFDMTFETLFNDSFPKDKFTPTSFPALFDQ